MACEKFLKSLAKNKQFWNREVLKFFEIRPKDLKHFLDKHQEYLKQQEINLGGPAFERASSYWDRSKKYVSDDQDDFYKLISDSESSETSYKIFQPSQQVQIQE